MYDFQIYGASTKQKIVYGRYSYDKVNTTTLKFIGGSSRLRPQARSVGLSLATADVPSGYEKPTHVMSSSVDIRILGRARGGVNRVSIKQ